MQETNLSKANIRAIWIAALVIGGAALALELLPLVLGVGGEARVDWSSTYVAFHFLLLPLACVLHVAVAVALFLRLRRSDEGRVASSALASTAIPIAYLLVLYFHPLFWFV